MSKGSFLILHNLRSVHNVGAIFRTADCAGIEKIFLTGYTPTPQDRFGRIRTDFHKAALGTEEWIPWENHVRVLPVISRLQAQGVQVVAVEQVKGAVDYKSLSVVAPTAFVFGNEVRGLSGAVLSAADLCSFIPQRGRKESLNVSVAAGIFLFRVLNI